MAVDRRNPAVRNRILRPKGDAYSRRVPALLQQVDALIASVGPTAFLVLGLAAALEYVVPPFPGDAIVLLGGVYAARGQQPWFWVLAVVTAGSMLGATINYKIGQFLDRKFERRLERKAFLGISLEKLHRVEQKMRERGAWLILFNRFIPGIRGAFFVAAGMSQMPLGKVLALGAVSAIAHALLILWAGIALGGNAERVGTLVAHYQNAIIALFLIAGLAMALRWWIRRRAQGASA